VVLSFLSYQVIVFFPFLLYAAVFRLDLRWALASIEEQFVWFVFAWVWWWSVCR
jgi:hypothetical protein